jgi:hypothetical protein
MTLLELYQSHRLNGINCKNFHSVLVQAHWFTVNSVFDPKTGEALPQALSAFLARVARIETSLRLHDRLWRITEHARLSVERLIHTLNESPRREHALLPVRAVRELDANSFIKLSNRPGRNIREKLAGKPYLQAVRRFQSVNLPENCLLKACVIRLAELLELRRDWLGEEEDELLPRIQSWLISDEAQAIARWDNLPPNNTLLSHRDYRRVWDAWRWLQTLDEDIARDFSKLEAREETMRRWSEYGRMYREETHLFADMPVLFDYETFAIQPWVSQLAVKKATRIHPRFLRTSEVRDAACIDLTVMCPRYAVTMASTESLPEFYLWQQWKNATDCADIELFSSDAAHLRSDATSIASSDLFFPGNNNPDHLDRAARAFAAKLRGTFKNDTFIWLVPDYLNDFQLEILRRNLNARFPNAEPLPRSVAAVIEHVKPVEITKDGYPIVVVDTIGGTTCVTKLLARLDPELKKRLPMTRGFYWERCPPVIIASTAPENTEEKDYDIITVDDKGQWRDATRPAPPQFIDMSSLKSEPRIGQFSNWIQLTESPVVGGICLHELQQRVGDIPLWRDQIRELSIKVIRDGRYQRFHLVSRGTTVKPIRGLAIPIPVDEDFTLLAGKTFYQFPLFLGENADELGFSARLDSPAFPLKEDVVCKLNVFFEYGADETYKLAFSPIDKSFPPVRATWQRTEEVIITDAPSPEYPEPLSWHVLHSWRDAQGNEVDVLQWLIDALKRLLAMIPIRCAMTISSAWKAKRDSSGNEYWFAFAQTEDGKECYCNTKQFVIPYNGNPNDGFPHGMQMFASIHTMQDGGVAAFEMSSDKVVAMSREIKQRIVLFRERSLQNRIGLIWADARSLTDPTCPPQFRGELKQIISELLKQLPLDIVNRKMMCLLACLHKDTTNDCVKWITDQIERNDIRDPRAIGFALGDVMEVWQQYIFQYLVSRPDNMAISVFAYAIWRERHFVERFSTSSVQAVLKALSERLRNINLVTASELSDSVTRRDWRRDTAETLELLLGLLRTRASSDPEIRKLLKPHQQITKELAKQVERVTEIVAQSNVPLFSRVQINLQKSESERTPDLLYALRLYLTGDDGANAIHIKSISDNDDD